MSDAMTNREIEDVLTSIRRLVAQEGRRPETGRLILTPAQRVMPPAGHGAPDAATEDREGRGLVAASQTPSGTVPPVAAPPVDSQDAAITRDVQSLQSAETDQGTLPEPDFRRLEATIAELEAAVSASGAIWEPDGSEPAPPAHSNVTELYGKLSFVHGAMHARKAATAPGPASEQTPYDQTPYEQPRFERLVSAQNDPTPPESATARQSTAKPEPAEAGAGHDAADREAAGRGAADGDSTDDEGAFFETVIDEATLRILVAQIVREELHGQLGERITMQVRKLVRSEIARVLDERNLV